MIIEQKIALNKEYIVSKISGYLDIRRKINKIGIKPYDKIIFIKSRSSNYKFKLNEEKHTKKIPKDLLNNIELFDSDIYDLKDKIQQSLANIRINVFRSDITNDLDIFNKISIYKYKDYNFNIVYHSSIPSIYGENYENKRIRNDILTNFPDIFLGIIDYENIESDLYLVSQFMDMDAKIVLVLRNYNTDSENNNKIDFSWLVDLIEIPIVFYEENQSEEFRSIVYETILKTYQEPIVSVMNVSINYGRKIENKISKIKKTLVKKLENNFLISPRFFAINLLEKDILSLKAHFDWQDVNKLQNLVRKEINTLEKKYSNHIFTILKESRKRSVKKGLAVVSADKVMSAKKKKSIKSKLVVCFNRQKKKKLSSE